MLSFALRKRLGRFQLDVQLSSRARRVVLFGPSGSGKSLTLQCLAGLLRPDEGCIKIDGQALFDSAGRLELPPEQRRIGYVPQSAALFPHLDVAANVVYGLRHAPVAERQETAAKLLRLVRLEGFERRRPSQLSGGEQQRVALARALAIGPRLLLLDEPFSALDNPVRAVLRQELLDLQAALGFAWAFVTHDLEEAYLLADDVAVYDAGRILQAGPRDEVFYRPRSVQVARLVGFRNVFTAASQAPATVTIQTSAIDLAVVPPSGRGLLASAFACIRQEDVRVVRKDRPSADLTDGTRLRGEIVEERHLGFTVTLRFAIDAGVDLWVDVAMPAYRSLKMATDKHWELFIPRQAVHLIAA